MGGVPPAACASAPTLQQVQQELQQLTAGQLLVGHYLAKDLAALGLGHPPQLRFDTMTFPPFCNKAGSSRTLKQLAQQFLSQDIQKQKQRRKGRQRRRHRSRAQQEQDNQQQGGNSTSSSEAQPQQLAVSAADDGLAELASKQQKQQQPTQPLVAHPVPGDGQVSQQQDSQQQQQQQSAHQHSFTGIASGHDPEEDAAAVMQLYQQVRETLVGGAAR